jgi:outer membrane protein assembly factor BamA
MQLPGLLIVALVLCAATRASAQPAPESFSGRPVTAVHVSVVSTTDPTLIDLLETRPGQNLSLAAVRESIAHLHSLARFQDVQVEAVDGSNGAIELRYNLVAIRAVDRVEFRGNLAPA